MIVEQLSIYGDVECNESLAKHTTFRIGGKARYFIYPKNEVCLLRILEILQAEKIAVKVFGKGSNLLCSDDDFDGAVLCLDRYFTDFYFEEDGICIAQAGCSIIQLAHEAMKHAYSGLEFASGIPGTLGGALYMNAGAYKSSMSDIVTQVLVLSSDGIRWMDAAELGYSYRTSYFQKHADWIILGAKMQLQKANQSEIFELMNTRRKRRMETQPLDKPCAGSMFRNPDGVQAWELIEGIGYRGHRIGGAMVSNKHCNFIVNEDQAHASDIDALVREIQEKVKAKFNIDLHTEVEKFNWKK